MSTLLVWAIAAGVLAGVLLRPKGWPEAVWAGLGAVLLVGSGLLPVSLAWVAIVRGTDVYLFLTGMMLLAEMARREGVFDWVASHAVSSARGSRARLFSLVYVAGIGVTAFLSNDATAVVLTPAVYAAVQKARVTALPYLFICAFIANAASFVLPISNPANLVVYGKTLPPLISWLRIFLLPSGLAILATYIVLRWIFREALKGQIESGFEAVALSKDGRLAAWGIAITGLVLIGASSLGLDLGMPTLISAVLAVAATTRADSLRMRTIAKRVSWSILPLVAGLFILVEALNRSGALRGFAKLLQACAGMTPVLGSLVSAAGVALLSNVTNNLPSGLLIGGALQTSTAPAHIRDAVLIGVDLGPNLSVTGSLATVLWLIALRREGQEISGWQFFRVGILVMPPALIAAALAVAVRW